MSNRIARFRAPTGNAELDPERAVFDGRTLALRKYACASAYHVIFSPAAK